MTDPTRTTESLALETLGARRKNLESFIRNNYRFMVSQPDDSPFVAKCERRINGYLEELLGLPGVKEAGEIAVRESREFAMMIEHAPMVAEPRLDA